MYRLFLFLKRYHVFFLFVFLEIIAFWMVVNYNRFQSASFFNTSNAVVASTLRLSNVVTNFVTLQDQNDVLVAENGELRRELQQLRETQNFKLQQESKNPHLEAYEYISAKVIRNTTHQDNNYLTINVGANDSVAVGMGVVGQKGVIGKVVSVSGNYATVQSLLHSDYHISSQIASNRVIGSVVWGGEDITTGHMKFVPRHIRIKKDDAVVTSGFNAIFPEGIPIGKIIDYSLPQNESFYDIKLALSTDFSTLYYVYVVKNKQKKEQQSLEKSTEEK